MWGIRPHFFWIVILSGAAKPRSRRIYAFDGYNIGVRNRRYFVYIMTNRSGTVYTGMTSALGQRVWQHKDGDFAGFTSRYRVDRLVYFEEYRYVLNAISREKQIKRWRRLKKIDLIVGLNPTWRDLSEDWGKPIEYIDPSTRRTPPR